MAAADPALLRLAAWAAELHVDAVPEPVLLHARLQALGALGLAGALGAAGAVGAGLAAAAEADAWLPLSGGASAAVEGALSAPGSRALNDVLVAIVAANEVSGRVGLAQALGPRGWALRAQTAGVAAAVARGRAAGLDARAMAGRIGAALCQPPPSSPGPALRLAVDAALRGLGDDVLDVNLDEPSPVMPAPALLRPAWSGLGRAWLSRALVHRPHPGPLRAQVPLQALDEVLRRHVKAAEKRLRFDQIERIELRVGGGALGEVGALGWPAGAGSLAQLAGALVVGHSLSLGALREAMAPAHAERVAAVAGRIAVHTDPVRALCTPLSLLSAMPQLLGGLPWGLRARAAGQLLGGARAGLGPAWWRGLPPVSVEAVLGLLRDAGDDLGEARLEELVLRFDTELVVYTTRGGAWRERRERARGGPGAPWGQTVDDALDRAASGLHGAPAAAAEARAAFEAQGATDAAAWAAPWRGPRPA